MYKIQRFLKKVQHFIINNNPYKYDVKILYDSSSLLNNKSPLKVCIYNHYDASGRIADYVLWVLKKIKEAGFNIIFLTTSPSLEKDEWSKLTDSCMMVCKRKNLGLDIGGWPVGIKIIEKKLDIEFDQICQILITNDSIYGPLYPLKPVFERMTHKNYDIWGITDSEQRKYHLQSYFIVFEKVGLIFFRKWIQNFDFLTDRSLIIDRYEIGLSHASLTAGLRIGAFVPYTELVRYVNENPSRILPTVLESFHNRNGKLNPTLAFWKESITVFRSPFLKKDIPRHFQEFDYGCENWQEIFQAYNIEFPIQLIHDDLLDYNNRTLSTNEIKALSQKFGKKIK